MTLTPEKIAKYNENPDHCPYCGALTVDSHAMLEDVVDKSCETCGERWLDAYEFIGIVEPGNV